MLNFIPGSSQSQADHDSVSMQWLCPNLTTYWHLGQIRDSDQVVLQAIEGQQQHRFTADEGFALRYFTGRFPVAQVQSQCEQQFGETMPPDFVLHLLQKLIDLGLLISEHSDAPSPVSSPQEDTDPFLKPCVHWIQTSQGYWILRNPEDITFLQVSDRDYRIITALSQGHSLQQILQTEPVEPSELQYLMKLLAATGMLNGSTPPKPPKAKKFNPMKLTFFKIRVCNPDRWLTQHVHTLRWIWTKSFFLTLLSLLSLSAVFGLHQRAEILLIAQRLMQPMNPATGLGFILLTALVVTLHELGHAFTLKHYDRIVPEMGFMFMCFTPVAYTNTSDQYSLPKRRQRLFVVGAGILCQLTLAAIAFWGWNSSASGSWLSLTQYLLMMAALFTVALNLNPLAKFDGYYLAVALTGINNLKQRSFQLYRDWFQLKPSAEQGSDRWILAAYAPFSLLYVISVFGFLLLRLGDWTMTHIPITALVLLGVWLIYFFMPSPQSE
jgi:putative peptide zinc metalloprotease protein